MATPTFRKKEEPHFGVEADSILCQIACIRSCDLNLVDYFILHWNVV